MELKSLKCSKCGGLLRQIGDGKYICGSCGTSFMADYDQEDVEYEKIKIDAELKKKEMEMAERRMEVFQNTTQNVGKKVRTIAIVMISIFVCMTFISIFAGISRMTQTWNSHSASADWKAQRESQGKALEEEAERIRESQEKVAELIRQKEEEEKKLWESYQITTEDVLKDETFVNNAKPALRSALDYRANLTWTNWIWEREPEYLTSYLLVAEDQNSRHKNMLVSFYVVHWTWDLGEDNKDYYDVYDATVLYDISLKDDGTIKSDYKAQDFANHSEIPKNQFLNGFFDRDQLYREAILGKSDYKVTEFDFSDEEP